MHWDTEGFAPAWEQPQVSKGLRPWPLGHWCIYDWNRMGFHHMWCSPSGNFCQSWQIFYFVVTSCFLFFSYIRLLLCVRIYLFRHPDTSTSCSTFCIPTQQIESIDSIFSDDWADSPCLSRYLNCLKGSDSLRSVSPQLHTPSQYNIP